jgi:hypothetical protein
MRANLVGIAQARASGRYGQIFKKRNIVLPDLRDTRAVTAAVAGTAD